MRPIVFNKVIISKDVIKGIEDIYIEDNISYEMKDNDLSCLGSVIINFTVDNGVEKINKSEKVNIDCQLSLSKIDCQKDLKLHFKDYQVQIDERIIRFSLRYELLGNGERVIAFHEIEGEEVEDKVINAMNREFTTEKEEQTINMLKELMKNDGLDIIGAEDLLPVLSNSVEDIDLEEIDIENEEIIEPLIIIPNEKEVVVEEDDVEEETKATEEKQVENTNNQLGFKEKYVVAFFFYKVTRDDETYEDISKKFNIDINQVRATNKDEKLYKGKLVKIAK